MSKQNKNKSAKISNSTNLENPVDQETKNSELNNLVLDANQIKERKVRGRKSIVVNFPQGNFTLNQLNTLLNTSTKFLSKASIQQKINKAVLAGQLFKTGKEDKNGSRGRKQVIYSATMAN